MGRKNEMKTNEMFKGQYLSAKDVEKGDLTLTIESVEFEELENRQDGRTETLPVMRFKGEEERGLVIRPTVAGQLEGLYGSDDTDDWVGRRVTLFFDGSVRFGNSRGGVRVRPNPSDKPENQGPDAAGFEDDDIAF
jgi:hypothetical protein